MKPAPPVTMVFIDAPRHRQQGPAIIPRSTPSGTRRSCHRSERDTVASGERFELCLGRARACVIEDKGPDIPLAPPDESRSDRFLQEGGPAGVGDVALQGIDPAESGRLDPRDRGDQQPFRRGDRLVADRRGDQDGERVLGREIKVSERTPLPDRSSRRSPGCTACRPATGPGCGPRQKPIETWTWRPRAPRQRRSGGRFRSASANHAGRATPRAARGHRCGDCR